MPTTVVLQQIRQLALAIIAKRPAAMASVGIATMPRDAGKELAARLHELAELRERHRQHHDDADDHPFIDVGAGFDELGDRVDHQPQEQGARAWFR